MIVRLGDICKKETSNIVLKDIQGHKGDYPIYGASGFISTIDFYQQDKPYIAVVKDGAGIGRVMKLPAKSSVVGTMQYIIPNNTVDISYLAYAMENMSLSKYFTGATIPHIYFKDYQKEELFLPPIAEQQKIAAELDKISTLIDKRRQQLEKLDLLVKAKFVEMFGDLAAPECKHKRCKLEEACVSPDDIKCGPFGTQLSKNEYQEHGIAVWEIPQINSEFREQPTHFLTDEKAKQLSSYSLIPEDIAMSRKGNVGRCSLFPRNFSPGIIHSDVLRIRVDKSRVNPCFMMYQLHFSRAVERQIEVISSGAIMSGINVSKLKKIYVHIPAFDLQQQFAYFVEQAEKTKNVIRYSLEKLETLKKAQMQKYFG